MWRNAYDSYLEDRILSADPVELVQMLFQGCLESVRTARRHLADGQILARSRSITKACDILMELTGSLDKENGGEVGANLARLYDYLRRRLLEANVRQSDAYLAECEGLLETLAEAWMGIGRPAPVEASRETAWMPAMAVPELAHASGGWSF